MVLCVLLWIPHIIHKAKTNNKYGFPFVFILSSTYDKLIYPLYFRGNKNNFLGSKDNFALIIIMVIFVCITIIIMYLQVLKGPRFMLSVSINQFKYDFYKEKNELIEIRDNIRTEECVICLLPIFESEKMIEMEDKSEKKNKTEEKIDIDLDIDDKIEENNISSNNTCDTSILIIDSQNEGEKTQDHKNENEDNVNDILFISNENNKISEDYDKINSIEKNENEKFFLIRKNEILMTFYNKFKNILKDIFFILRLLFYENLFSFYKKSDNAQGKTYMYTPCNHVFHAQCLEQWLEYKKECPNCRTSMEEFL